MSITVSHLQQWYCMIMLEAQFTLISMSNITPYDFSTLTKLLFRHIWSEIHQKKHKNELSVTINSAFRHSHTPAYQNQGQHWEDVVDRVTEERPPGQSDGLWTRNGGKSGESVTFHFLCNKYAYSTCPANIPQTPMMIRMLKTADPTIVPNPRSPLVMNTPDMKTQLFIDDLFTATTYWKTLLEAWPIKDVKSSGAELPAAMKVAPATSSLRCRFWKYKLQLSICSDISQ